MHLRFESNVDHIPGEIEISNVFLVPLKKCCSLIVYDIQVLHFSCSDVWKEEVLDPLEDGVEDKPDDVKDHSQQS